LIGNQFESEHYPSRKSRSPAIPGLESEFVEVLQKNREVPQTLFGVSLAAGSAKTQGVIERVR
jgi:hypothetical protein